MVAMSLAFGLVSSSEEKDQRSKKVVSVVLGCRLTVQKNRKLLVLYQLLKYSEEQKKFSTNIEKHVLEFVQALLFGVHGERHGCGFGELAGN